MPGETATWTPADPVAPAFDVDPQGPEVDAASRKTEWYDRSSLAGDYMVTIEGQSPDDWEKFAPESRICEYLDGVVYMPSPVSIRHQQIVIFLADLLNGFRWEGRCGEVLTGPAPLRLSWLRKLEPDIFVLPASFEPEKNGTRDDLKAELVIEVLSPSNRSHDLERKAKVYQDAGIPEIWYVDESREQLHVDHREITSYSRITQSAETFVSRALMGFWIDVGWLWKSPLPNPRECLKSLLSTSTPDS